MKKKDIVLQLENITKIYHGKEEFCAIREASLSVYKGEILGIVGSSGAGKSTLLRCMNDLEKPSSGRIIFNGESFKDCSEKKMNQIRSKIGMIFQQFQLFDQKTILQNVMFPLQIHGKKKKQAKEEAWRLLQWVGLSQKANCYPQTLSGGQKQRVAIARALVNQPELLLCDEATSALDPETTETIISLLKRANREMGVTIVFISHQSEVVERLATRVAEMQDGVLKCEKERFGSKNIGLEGEPCQVIGFH